MNEPAHTETWTAEPGAAQRDPRTYLRILWRWKWLFLVVALIVPLAVHLLRSAPAPVQYQASTLLQVQTLTVDTSLFTQTSAPAQSLETAARLIQTSGVAREAAEFLEPPPDNPRTLLGQIDVEPDTEAGFITITGTASRRERAADIANAFASAVVETREEKAVQELSRTIGRVEEQLETLDQNDTGREQLSEELQRLRALRAAQGSNAEVVEPAVGASAVPNADARRTTILSILVGLMLAAGAVLLAESADRRIRTPTELEEFTDLPLLSAIPATAFTPSGAGAHAAEAFQMLRGALTYFNVDRRVSSVVLTSAGQQDGKTTVATQLALAVARAGKRVVLVDTDLRQPQVCTRLGIESPALGLGSVLAGDAALNEVLVEYPMDEDVGSGRLLILPGGQPPPNPSELLSSQNMRHLLAALEDQCDLVLIDTAAALAVSDALPLLAAASGVVLVARMERSTRDAVRRMQRVVLKASGQPLGVVATGTSSRSDFSGYNYYAHHNGHGNVLGRLTRRGRERVRLLQRS